MSFQTIQASTLSNQETVHVIDDQLLRATMQWGGYASISGAACMVSGALLWISSGTDIWQALANDAMATYLPAAAAAQTVLVANTTFWILGVLLLGVAGTTFVNLCGQRPALARVAGVCFSTAVPLAIVAFITMLAVVLQVGADASTTGVAIANVVGWIGARADDLATALIVGAGPLFIALAGQGDWVPTWLVRWGYLAGVTGLISLVAMYQPSLADLGFMIVPIGLGWMIAAGVVLLRRSKHGG